MNFYLRRTPFTPTFVRFAAKCNAICRKMQCVLMLNAMRFGAKRKVKCGKMRCDLVLNAV